MVTSDGNSQGVRVLQQMENVVILVRNNCNNNCHSLVSGLNQTLQSDQSKSSTHQVSLILSVSFHEPAVGCVTGGSCHTGLRHHPGLCLSGQCCRLVDSCRGHSGPLQENDDLKITKSNLDSSI